MRPEVKAAFEQQKLSCHELGSPFNALVCGLLGERLDASSQFGARIVSWPGRPVHDALPLRAAGALHALARSGRAAALASLYPPAPIPEPDLLWTAIADALRAHDQFLEPYLDSPPQTNEVARSSVLLGAALAIAARTSLPLSWHEIGASAGLNLAFDRYRYELGRTSHGDSDAKVVIRSTWEGDAPSLATPLELRERAGCDVNPLDPSSPALRERLMAYIWPDQEARLHRTAAALELAANAPWRVQRAPASSWLRERLAAPAPPGVARVLAHTIVWQYLPPEEKDAIRATLHAAGSRATADRPLAWFSMEGDGAGEGAALRLTLWPGEERHALGRADFHGRWVRWTATR